MKKILFSITFALGFFILASTSDPIDGIEVLELLKKDFKHIIKFNKTYSSKEIKEIEKMVKAYNPSIEIKFSRLSEISPITNLTIEGIGIKCESMDFGSGLIVINENGSCICALSKL